MLQSDLLSANTGLQAPRRITTWSVAWFFNLNCSREDYATSTLEADLAHLALESDSLDLALISCPEIRDIELDLPRTTPEMWRFIHFFRSIFYWRFAERRYSICTGRSEAIIEDLSCAQLIFSYGTFCDGVEERGDLEEVFGYLKKLKY